MTRLAHKLHDRCILQEITQTNMDGDDEGSLEPTYTDLKRFWASIEDTGGREFRLERSVAASGNVRVRVRPSDDFKKDHFVRRPSTLHPDRLLIIRSIQPVSKDEAYLWCEDIEEETL